jgi:UDP-N-acetylglucosamine--N-acetylmuramyl-(pentapeptide) pyrophosphoryl-undecaprenol N-acetylglucosamine transferase
MSWTADRHFAGRGPCGTVALVAGATAGHLAPALAVVDALAGLAPDVRCLLLHPRETSGAWILEGRDLATATLEAHPFYGTDWTQRLALPRRIVAATLDARRRLRDGAVDVVLAFGGFGTFEVSLAARSLGLPVLVHEANARAGISTRLASRLAAGVFLAEDEAARDFPPGTCRVTGMPVRPEFFEVATERKAKRTNDTAGRRLLVVGGSLGSTFLDLRFPAVAGAVLASGVEIEVTHLAGGGNTAAIEAAYREVPVRALDHVRDMAGALLDADFVISRAGASSLAEIAASETPALFVPLPGHARDHQVANLETATRRVPLWWIREQDWSDAAVASQLAQRLRDPRALAEAGEAMHAMVRPEAASLLAEAVVAALPDGPATPARPAPL